MRNKIKIFLRRFRDKFYTAPEREDHKLFSSRLDSYEKEVLLSASCILVINLFLTLGWLYSKREEIDVIYKGEWISTTYFIYFILWMLFLALPFPFFKPYSRYEAIVMFAFWNAFICFFLTYLLIVFTEETSDTFIDLGFLEIKRGVWTFEKLSLFFDQELERLNLESTLKEKMISLKPKILHNVDDREQLMDRFYSTLRKLKYTNDEF